jgi:N-hydroxyarylamine O-acetyltransferase
VALSGPGDNYWRFSETARGEGAAFSFDFRDGPADETLLAHKCRFLQTDPASQFTQNLVVQRRTCDRHLSLRGRVLASIHATGTDTTLLNCADELVATLRDSFDLDVPEAANLWPAVCARHETLFGRADRQNP